MELAIIGAGEMAQELYNLIITSNKKNEYDKIYFVDTDENVKNNTISEKKYLLTDRSSSEILIAMGEPYMRKKMAEKYSKEGFKMTTFVHPMSYISPDTSLEAGCIILPFVYVAQNTKIGKNVLVHSGCKIENDCKIGDNCFISSNAFVGAKTTIEDTCFVGPSSSIRDRLKIGHDSIIGMGAVLTKSTDELSVCYGNPAKKIRTNATNKVFK